MSSNFRFWEYGRVVNMITPETDASGTISSYFSISDAHKATIIVALSQANAATVEISLLQATDTSGTNSKPITANLPFCVAENSGVNVFVESSAANYTTGAALDPKIVMIEVQPAVALDINNIALGPFTTIAVDFGASNIANIGTVLMYLSPLRYAGLNPV